MKTPNLGSLLAVGLTCLFAQVTTVLAAEKATYLGSYTWRSGDAELGGLSGIEITDNGMGFVALSDRAKLVKGSFTRDKTRITGVQNAGWQALRDPKGQPLKDALADSEGLALADDGTLFISFEWRHRVWAYSPGGKATALPRAQDFKGLQANSGLEALAIDARGRLYTLPERSGQMTRPFPVWRFDGKGWSQPFSLRRDAGFLPVGADFGPDGWFYLLERQFTGYGFRSRVRRFDVTGDKVHREETLLESPALRHDNLEGISVWRANDGTIRMTMVSDDNFRPFLQRTEFVEYAVTESLASQSTKR
ncbi:esterase-like activity of phytase family protein [Tropicibacter oceani]|uniref:Esterase-like activity of phytase family protein n=1 Tax=Tropicibacter oceani TaxID=3058420 RepID=A0ABY8QJL2_9RHOB|nr:esterase-like activity of phytase family protein [Tropicibacter oceani]WGW04705.1 esterase-like activity of phytase family protein [Tropicibacter oceani]